MFACLNITTHCWISQDTLDPGLLPVTLYEGRDDLMWSLLQFISGSIAKNSTEDFISVLYLMEVLYPDPDRGGEILAVPELTDPACVKKLAAAAVYIHLTTKVNYTLA